VLLHGHHNSNIEVVHGPLHDAESEMINREELRDKLYSRVKVLVTKCVVTVFRLIGDDTGVSLKALYSQF
jgi:hypothetical protein